MNAPILSLPVARGPSKYAVSAALGASGCNFLSCAARVAQCLSQCVPDPFSQGCRDCLGSLWGECHECIGL